MKRMLMMKVSITRPYVYLLILSVVLFISVLIIAFALLIPKGKDYRLDKASLRGIKIEQNRVQVFNDKTYKNLKNLQSKNRAIITAFSTKFNAKRFEKQNSKFFEKFVLGEKQVVTNEYESFDVYEVNASSKIDSPKSFYNFLEAINKGDWIVSVEFPIIFKREAKLIHSSFKIKVYSNSKNKIINKELNSTK